jgi:long-chain acyl-CoA synthetase
MSGNPDTLVDLFIALEGHEGDFLVYDDGYRVRRHTYRTVTRAARAFAARLHAAGLTKGDAVVLWGENRPEWIACYWGCVISGIVVVPIDYRSSAGFVSSVAALVTARLLVVGDDVRGTARLDGPTWRFDEVPWDTDAPMPAVAMARDDVAQIVFTSGATATPKGVVIRHANILANVVPVAREIAKYRRYARPFLPLRFLNLLPLSHMFGQSMATSIPPMLDGTVVFMRNLNPHDIVRLVKQWRVSVIVCVPKMLEILKDHALRIDPTAAALPAHPLSIPRRWWRYRRLHRAFGLKFWAFVVGAAALPPALEAFWRRLGFVVIQGYGLTETAPIVTLNHPFKTTTGSVGTPIAGVEVRIAEDGEILVRGENVTTGYYNAAEPDAGRTLDRDGWLHTGDVGSIDPEGRVFVRGRKKEMIVLPNGLNVFPEDVERVLNTQPGVVEAAAVGAVSDGREHVHAVLVLTSGGNADAVISGANAALEDHQRVGGVSLWKDGPLPRTEGTAKLKRTAIREWVETGTASAAPIDATSDAAASVTAIVGHLAHGRTVTSDTALDDLGLSSLDRVELLGVLEDRMQTRLDESQVAAARTIADLERLVSQRPPVGTVAEPIAFPRWNRHPLARLIRRVSLATWILPLARLFARIRVEGGEHLHGISGPVVFAANHQSHFDVPVILAAMPGRVRAMVAPAMSKEFFAAHFAPAGRSWREVLAKRIEYYLAALFFNAFPLPQREVGARQTLRYIGEVAGDGSSVLIFPEGVRSQTGAMVSFRPGIGMIAARLGLPIVPVRIDDVYRVLPVEARWPTPGPVRVTFGPPMVLRGDDYAALAKEVEGAVRRLESGGLAPS